MSRYRVVSRPNGYSTDIYDGARKGKQTSATVTVGGGRRNFVLVIPKQSTMISLVR
jgi:hypothetical protein